MIKLYNITPLPTESGIKSSGNERNYERSERNWLAHGRFRLHDNSRDLENL